MDGDLIATNTVDAIQRAHIDDDAGSHLRLSERQMSLAACRDAKPLDRVQTEQCG